MTIDEKLQDILKAKDLLKVENEVNSFLDELLRLEENELETVLVTIFPVLYAEAPRRNLLDLQALFPDAEPIVDWQVDCFNKGSLEEKTKIIVNLIFEKFSRKQNQSLDDRNLNNIASLCIELKTLSDESHLYDLYTRIYELESDPISFHGFVNDILYKDFEALFTFFSKLKENPSLAFTQNNSYPEMSEFINQGLELIKENTSYNSLKEILESKCTLLFNADQLELRLIKLGMNAIVSGHYPALVEKEISSELESILQADAGINQIIELFSVYADKAVKEGLLALEDDLHDIENDFLRQGLQLIIDGTYPDTVRRIFDITIHAELSAMERRSNLIIDGALSIQSGDNPRIVREILSGYGLPELRSLMESFADKARSEGLLSLQDDMNEIEEPLFQQGLYLIISGVDPELVREILTICKNSEISKAGAIAKMISDAILAVQQGKTGKEVKELMSSQIFYGIERLVQLSDLILLSIKQNIINGDVELFKNVEQFKTEYPLLYASLYLIANRISENILSHSMSFLFEIQNKSIELFYKTALELLLSYKNKDFKQIDELNTIFLRYRFLNTNENAEQRKEVDAIRKLEANQNYPNDSKGIIRILQDEKAFPEYIQNRIKSKISIERVRLMEELFKKSANYELSSPSSSEHSISFQSLPDIIKCKLIEYRNHLERSNRFRDDADIFTWDKFLKNLPKEEEENKFPFSNLLRSIYSYPIEIKFEKYFWTTLVGLDRDSLNTILKNFPSKLRNQIEQQIQSSSLTNTEIENIRKAFLGFIIQLKEYNYPLPGIEEELITKEELERHSQFFNSTILSLSDEELGLVFRELDENTILKSIKPASQELQDRILNLLNQDSYLNLDLEVIGYIPRNTMQESQSLFLSVLDKLKEMNQGF